MARSRVAPWLRRAGQGFVHRDVKPDRRRVAIQFRRFVDAVDRPPPAIRAQVDDAKARLTKLSGDARK